MGELYLNFSFFQDFVFEAMGSQNLIIDLCGGGGCYRWSIGNNNNKRTRLRKKDGVGAWSTLNDASHSETDEIALTATKFKRYRFRLVLQEPGKLKIVVGSGYENFAKFLETTDESDIISIDSVKVNSQSNLQAAYVRNFRNFGSTEACTNNVGSFVCR